MRTTELSTVEADGRRKWVYPVLRVGTWFRRRKAVAYLLLVWLLMAPWIKIHGRQIVLFDLLHGRVEFFGITYWANETIVFLGFVFLILATILILTALFGRVFCGWACPQTVFMEFVFRPIERLIEGEGFIQRQFHSLPLVKRIPKSGLKLGIFALIALVIANTLIAYFFGTQHVLKMIADGPFEHLSSFFGMLIIWGIVFFQFAWFREQVCTFVCPYGRLQSLLLDRDSLIVVYDKIRGEPRGKPKKVTGDCVDCKMCIKVCPTGIDIREGLQMECLHCTQCIDACNDVMAKMHRPLNLIRYDTERAVEGQGRKIIRPRLFGYGAVLALSIFLLIGFGVGREALSASIHREPSSQLFSLDAEQKVVNALRLHLRNRSDDELSVSIKALAPTGLEVFVPQGEIHLKPEQKETVHFLLKLPKESFRGYSGSREVQLQIEYGGELTQTLSVNVFGNAE